MRKILLLLGIAFSVQASYSQKSVYTKSPDNLFNRGKEMFIDNNYVGAIDALQEYQRITKDKKQVEEAQYMILSSQFYRGADTYLGTQEIGTSLKEYLEKHPSTIHRNQIAFFIGSTHFEHKEWDKASFWLAQADIDYLSLKDQEDHSYRAAYSYLQQNETDKAKRLFGLLSNNSNKYRDQASYYLAYIDFQDKNYASALPIFRNLKDKPIYREKATLFVIQGLFLENKLSEVISEGKEYVSSYPNTDSAAEIYRMVGNSYYRTGKTKEAITYYEKYVATDKKLLREDMYQLADAYYQTGQYSKTVQTLKLVASSNDQLGQAGNMLLGQTYLKLNDTTQALMAFDAASRAQFSPTISEEALYNYVILVSKGSVSTFGENITALQNFLTKYPNSKYKEDVNSTLASTLLSVKNYPMALSAIAKIQTPGRQILEAKQIILYQLGVQEFVDNNYEESITHFDAAIAQGNYDLNARNESYYWRADASFRLAEYSNAIKDYTNYTKFAKTTDANYASALYGVGYSHFKTKNYNAALTSFKQYISVERDQKSETYSDAQNRIGDCYLFNRNFAEAEKFYGNAVTSSPGNADYSEFQKAFVLGLQRNYAGKAKALDAMMSKYPDSPYRDNALFEKSRALVMLNKENEAITVIEKLLKEHPKTPLAAQAGVQLGQLYFNVNKTQQSIAAYKKVVAENPLSDEAKVAIKSMEGVYKDINDIESYANYLKTQGKGNILSASRQDSLTYLAAENVYMKNNKSEDAKIAFNKYLRAYPKGGFASDANFYLGNMAFAAKDFKSALASFNEVIASNNPKYLDEALLIASGIEFDNKDYDAAYKTYQHLSQASATAENKHVAQLGMLRCAYLTNKDTEVVTSADKLLENKLSTDVANEARFYRGRSLYRLERTSEAITDLELVAKQTRTAFGAESQFILAEIYYKQANYDKVEKQVLAFMKAGTSHEYWMARSIIVLADAYKAKNDNFQARQYLESLQANYKGGEKDIKTKVAERLANLGEQQ